MFLFCLVLAMFCARLFICALWSPAGKGLTSWLSFVVSSVSCHFPIGILGQVWYLIVSIPDLCNLITSSIYTPSHHRNQVPKVIQPIFKFPYLISLIKYPLVRHFK